jgi:hypothetical protein
MCSDGKQCYRKIGNDREVSLTSLSVPVLKEKRKKHNIASDGSLLGDCVK